MTEPNPLEVSVHIAARREVVYRYFVDPARYARWMGSSVTLDPVPGGIYRVFLREGVEASGHFVEVDPPRRLVFTWGWTNDPVVAPGATRVVVTLEEQDGGTTVVLRHFGLPDELQYQHHRKGWEMYLHRLVVRVAGGDPGPDPNV
jgi:uncharacterized protein YndB with AHSA1/START domain